MIEHKHAEVLRAIADGKTIQVRVMGSTPDQDMWVDISTRPGTCIYYEQTYRIKPEESHDKTI